MQKIYTKWINNLNIRAKIIKVLEENTGVNLRDFGFSSGFLVMTPEAPVTREKLGKSTSSKNLCA